jgi:hypothetical protein
MVVLIVVLDGCQSARLEALEAIGCQVARAIVPSAVAVGGVKGLNQWRAPAVTWAADFLIVSPFWTSRLRVWVEVINGHWVSAAVPVGSKAGDESDVIRRLGAIHASQVN